MKSVKSHVVWGAMGWLACTGCGVDQDAVQGGEDLEQWGVEGVEQLEVSQVGVNEEDPNVGSGCDLPRCAQRIGEHTVAPRVGTCSERGWIVSEDGSRELTYTREVEFNEVGRLARVDGATYTYEAGLLVEVSGDASKTTFTYDEARRLIARTMYEGGVEVSMIEYTHDARGRLTSRTERDLDEPEPSVRSYTYPNDSTQVMWFGEDTTDDNWFRRTAFDALGQRDMVVINSPAYGYETSQYIYEDGRITEYKRIGEPALSHFTIDYDEEGRPSRIGNFVSEGYNDHGVITREEGLTTLEVFTTRTGSERAEYVYSFEGDACERGTMEGWNGWLMLVRTGITWACGPQVCL